MNKILVEYLSLPNTVNTSLFLLYLCILPGLPDSDLYDAMLVLVRRPVVPWVVRCVCRVRDIDGYREVLLVVLVVPPG